MVITNHAKYNKARTKQNNNAALLPNRMGDQIGTREHAIKASELSDVQVFGFKLTADKSKGLNINSINPKKPIVHDNNINEIK